MRSFSVKGSPTCTVGRLASESSPKSALAMVAPWMPSRPVLGADIDDRIADAGGGGIEDLVLIGDADGHRVDEDVAVIGGVEIGLAAHVGTPTQLP